jgi:UDP-N-acetylmuramoyl-L-alanyl-D-glutamate--2,6-diaminopimelate ligase
MMAASSTTVSAIIDHLPASLLREVVGDATTSVSEITHDSRTVATGCMFVCIPGGTVDGHDFASAAVTAGATALMVERLLPLDVAQVVVTDARAAVGHAARAVFGAPSDALEMIGITGTNGKTTTAHLVSAILGADGRKVGVLGTLSGARTTPEAADLQRTLAEFVDDGTTSVVMEVSSHALALHRVNGVRFDVAAFTNLGRDHLDLHGTLEEYFRAKARLFTPELADVGVVNVDDPHGRLLADVGGIEIRTFSSDDVTDVHVTARAHAFTWRGQHFDVPIGGAVNVMNSVAALTVVDVLGVSAEVAAAGLATAGPVPGRFEVVAGQPELEFTVLVDYAHTPDGVSELLRSARQIAGSRRVLIVVGCGGERDVDKRPEMGAAAVHGADRVVLTSDNPRHEDPMAIIEAMSVGITGEHSSRVVVDPDRRAAIATALGEARTGDVVVIAGKGHETTQTIGDTVHPFDDRVVALELLEGLT